MGDRAGLPEEIAAALARGATVLTGRQRAARSLRQASDRSNRDAGLGSWVPAQVLAWDAWTAGLWHRLLLEGAAEQMLLNRTQERALWISIIQDDPELSTLRSIASLADLAADAWAMLVRYRGLGRLRGSATNHDTEAFARWAAVFQERCRERGYLTQARLEGALRQAWSRLPASLPTEREFLIVGFDRLLPAQQALLDDLRGAGRTVRTIGAAALPDSRHLLAAHDEEDEIQAVAEWARELLRQRPESRIAVLVPGLKDSQPVRAAVERTFRQVLAPGSLPITATNLPAPYEFSTGSTLDRTELGKVALALLDWTQEPLSSSRVSALLLSRCFAGAGEASERAEFDAYELQKEATLRPEVSLDRLIERLRGSKRDLPQLRTCLQRMQAVVRRSFGKGEQRSHAEWADAARDLLGAANWAGDGAMNSVGFQTRERWEGLLDELATLDFQGGRVPAAEAFTSLRGIAESTTFAPQSRDAPVQVMGPEEAAGLDFDAAWFLRAGEMNWPTPVSGSSLLAWPLRRELGMPGSDREADAEHARQMTERIAASTGEIVFSYARETADGPQRPSSVLKGLGLKATLASLRTSEAAPQVTLETLEDIVRLPPLPEGTLKGGVGVLKAQAACAFHAFAEYRLFATELESREPGWNASERGRAVHMMLEGFWKDARTQTTLKAMTQAERTASLRKAADVAIAKLQRGDRTAWDAAYLEAQRRRLLRLGESWLALEAARSLPFTVELTESEERDVPVGPLRLTLRLDRVDDTEHGKVLIDYKTGAINASVWHGDRPDEPQVPLYAALAEGMQLHAVAFGMVKPGDGMKLYGYEDKPGILSARAVTLETASLEEQVERWRGVVEQLAVNFAEGDTRVSPKVYPATCQYCAHRLICRLDVPSLHDDEEESSVEAMEDERG